MIPKLVFGRTGHVSTRALFGAAALGNVTQKEADETMDLLLSYGINHMDTAASYGEAEDRLGDWIKRHGRPFFLATKTGERTYQKAHDQIRRSLERMNVDQVDLIQLHNLVDPQEWETALGPGGALEAAIEARQQGLARFIGVTGHGLTVAAQHKRALENFDFDSVLLPLNFPLSQNPQYLADFNALVDLCQSRNVAVQTIKSDCRRPWGERERARATWYEPLEDQADVDLAIHWVMGRPGLFINTVGDIHVLPRVLDAASRFEHAPSAAEMLALAARREMSSLFVE
jgi:aryl-alcohol dehydrogenase-like predicted oxidoreductase